MARTKLVPKKPAQVSSSHIKDRQQILQACAIRRAPYKGKGKQPRDFTKTTSKKKYRPGVKALKEIRRYQTSTDLLIPKAPLYKCIKEITQELFPGRDFRYTGSACVVIQEAMEAYIVRFLEDAHMCALHAKRVTLMVRDMLLVKRLRGESFGRNL